MKLFTRHIISKICIILVTLITLSNITLNEVHAQACCSNSTPRGNGMWQDIIDKPFQGQCIGRRCYECKTAGTSCEWGGACLNPSVLPFECTGTQICDQYNNQCITRAAAPNQTVPCTDNPSQQCVVTAVGQLPADYGGFLTVIIRVGIGIGSGIAFLLIILGSYRIVSSQGTPDVINLGKDTITSAIIGLVFITMSVTLMQIIGFDILGLGALGFGAR